MTLVKCPLNVGEKMFQIVRKYVMVADMVYKLILTKATTYSPYSYISDF